MNKNDLIDFFAEFWEVDKAKITDDLKLDDQTLANMTSLRFYQFIAAVESNFTVHIENVNSILTFGDLWKNVK